MIIECPSCYTKFSLPEEQVKGISLPLFHCSRCGNYFEANINKQNSLEELASKRYAPHSDSNPYQNNEASSNSSKDFYAQDYGLGTSKTTQEELDKFKIPENSIFSASKSTSKDVSTRESSFSYSDSVDTSDKSSPEDFLMKKFEFDDFATNQFSTSELNSDKFNSEKSDKFDKDKFASLSFSPTKGFDDLDMSFETPKTFSNERLFFKDDTEDNIEDNNEENLRNNSFRNKSSSANETLVDWPSIPEESSFEVDLNITQPILSSKIKKTPNVSLKVITNPDLKDARDDFKEPSKEPQKILRIDDLDDTWVKNFGLEDSTGINIPTNNTQAKVTRTTLDHNIDLTLRPSHQSSLQNNLQFETSLSSLDNEDKNFNESDFRASSKTVPIRFKSNQPNNSSGSSASQGASSKNSEDRNRFFSYATALLAKVSLPKISFGKNLTRNTPLEKTPEKKVAPSNSHLLETVLNSTKPVLLFCSVPVVLFGGIWIWSKNIDKTPQALKKALLIDTSYLPIPAPIGVDTINVNSNILSLAGGQKIFEIKGVVLNGATESFKDFRLEFNFYDSDNRLLYTEVKDLSTTVEDTLDFSALNEVGIQKFKEIQQKQRNPKISVIKPNEKQPFRFVFFDMKADVAWYTSRIFSVRPARTSDSIVR